MENVFGSANLKLGLNTKEFNKEMLSTGNRTEKLLSGMKLSAQAFTDQWADLTSGIKDTKRIVSGILVSQAFYAISSSVVTASAAVLDFAKNMETAQVSMEYFVDGANKFEKAQSFLREINAFAAKTPFKTEEALALSKYMQAVGVSMGATKDFLRVITDTASATGATEENLQRIVFGLGQMLTKGRLANEEIRQLANANIPVYEILREELKLTGEQISNIGNEWVSADKAVVAILTGLEKRYAGAAEKISRTITGMTDTIADNARILAQIATSGMYDKLADRMWSVTQALESYRETATTYGSAGLAYQLLKDMDASGRTGTKILALAGNTRVLIGSFKELYNTAKPVIEVIGDSLYASITTAMWAATSFSAILQGAIHELSELGLVSDWTAGTMASLFITYKVASGIAFVGEAAITGAYNVYQLGSSMMAILPASIQARAGVALVSAGLVGLAVYALATLGLFNKLNNAMAGLDTKTTGNNLFPDDYEEAIAEYKKQMEAYSASIDQYADDYNKPFESISDGSEVAVDAFAEVTEASKKAAKAVKNSWTAAFDEVYTIPDSASAEVAGIADLATLLSSPLIKFPEIEDSSKKIVPPILQFSDIFKDALLDNDVLDSSMWAAMLPVAIAAGTLGIARGFTKATKEAAKIATNGADGALGKSTVKIAASMTENSKTLAKMIPELDATLKRLSEDILMYKVSVGEITDPAIIKRLGMKASGNYVDDLLGDKIKRDIEATEKMVDAVNELRVYMGLRPLSFSNIADAQQILNTVEIKRLNKSIDALNSQISSGKGDVLTLLKERDEQLKQLHKLDGSNIRTLTDHAKQLDEIYEKLTKAITGDVVTDLFGGTAAKEFKETLSTFTEVLSRTELGNLTAGSKTLKDAKFLSLFVDDLSRASTSLKNLDYVLTQFNTANGAAAELLELKLRKDLATAEKYNNLIANLREYLGGAPFKSEAIDAAKSAIKQADIRRLSTRIDELTKAIDLGGNGQDIVTLVSERTELLTKLHALDGTSVKTLQDHAKALDEAYTKLYGVINADMLDTEGLRQFATEFKQSLKTLREIADSTGKSIYSVGSTTVRNAEFLSLYTDELIKAANLLDDTLLRYGVATGKITDPNLVAKVGLEGVNAELAKVLETRAAADLKRTDTLINTINSLRVAFGKSAIGDSVTDVVREALSKAEVEHLKARLAEVSEQLTSGAKDVDLMTLIAERAEILKALEKSNRVVLSIDEYVKNADDAYMQFSRVLSRNNRISADWTEVQDAKQVNTVTEQLRKAFDDLSKVLEATGKTAEDAGSKYYRQAEVMRVFLDKLLKQSDDVLALNIEERALNTMSKLLSGSPASLATRNLNAAQASLDKRKANLLSTQGDVREIVRGIMPEYIDELKQKRAAADAEKKIRAEQDARRQAEQQFEERMARKERMARDAAEAQAARDYRYSTKNEARSKRLADLEEALSKMRTENLNTYREEASTMFEQLQKAQKAFDTNKGSTDALVTSANELGIRTRSAATATVDFLEYLDDLNMRYENMRAAIDTIVKQTDVAAPVRNIAEMLESRKLRAFAIELDNATKLLREDVAQRAALVAGQQFATEGRRVSSTAYSAVAGGMDSYGQTIVDYIKTTFKRMFGENALPQILDQRAASPVIKYAAGEGIALEKIILNRLPNVVDTIEEVFTKQLVDGISKGLYAASKDGTVVAQLDSLATIAGVGTIPVDAKVVSASALEKLTFGGALDTDKLAKYKPEWYRQFAVQAYSMYGDNGGKVGIATLNRDFDFGKEIADKWKETFGGGVHGRGDVLSLDALRMGTSGDFSTEAVQKYFDRLFANVFTKSGVIDVTPIEQAIQLHMVNYTSEIIQSMRIPQTVSAFNELVDIIEGVKDSTGLEKVLRSYVEINTASAGAIVQPIDLTGVSRTYTKAFKDVDEWATSVTDLAQGFKFSKGFKSSNKGMFALIDKLIADYNATDDVDAFTSNIDQLLKDIDGLYHGNTEYLSEFNDSLKSFKATTNDYNKLVEVLTALRDTPKTVDQSGRLLRSVVEKIAVVNSKIIDGVEITYGELLGLSKNLDKLTTTMGIDLDMNIANLSQHVKDMAKKMGMGVMSALYETADYIQSPFRMLGVEEVMPIIAERLKDGLDNALLQVSDTVNDKILKAMKDVAKEFVIDIEATGLSNDALLTQLSMRDITRNTRTGTRSDVPYEWYVNRGHEENLKILEIMQNIETTNADQVDFVNTHLASITKKLAENPQQSIESITRQYMRSSDERIQMLYTLIAQEAKKTPSTSTALDAAKHIYLLSDVAKEWRNYSVDILDNGKTLEQIYDELKKLIVPGRTRFIGQNIQDYDMPILKRTYGGLGFGDPSTMRDTLALSKQVFPTGKHDLSTLYKRVMGEVSEGAHNASIDTKMTMIVNEAFDNGFMRRVAKLGNALEAVGADKVDGALYDVAADAIRKYGDNVESLIDIARSVEGLQGRISLARLDRIADSIAYTPNVGPAEVSKFQQVMRTTADNIKGYIDSMSELAATTYDIMDTVYNISPSAPSSLDMRFQDFKKLIMESMEIYEDASGVVDAAMDGSSAASRKLLRAGVALKSNLEYMDKLYADIQAGSDAVVAASAEFAKNTISSVKQQADFVEPLMASIKADAQKAFDAFSIIGEESRRPVEAMIQNMSRADEIAAEIRALLATLKDGDVETGQKILGLVRSAKFLRTESDKAMLEVAKALDGMSEVLNAQDYKTATEAVGTMEDWVGKASEATGDAFKTTSEALNDAANSAADAEKVSREIDVKIGSMKTRSWFSKLADPFGFQEELDAAWKTIKATDMGVEDRIKLLDAMGARSKAFVAQYASWFNLIDVVAVAWQGFDTAMANAKHEIAAGMQLNDEILSASFELVGQEAMENAMGWVAGGMAAALTSGGLSLIPMFAEMIVSAGPSLYRAFTGGNTDTAMRIDEYNELNKQGVLSDAERSYWASVFAEELFTSNSQAIQDAFSYAFKGGLLQSQWWENLVGKIEEWTIGGLITSPSNYNTKVNGAYVPSYTPYTDNSDIFNSSLAKDQAKIFIQQVYGTLGQLSDEQLASMVDVRKLSATEYEQYTAANTLAEQIKELQRSIDTAKAEDKGPFVIRTDIYAMEKELQELQNKYVKVASTAPRLINNGSVETQKDIIAQLNQTVDGSMQTIFTGYMQIAKAYGMTIDEYASISADEGAKRTAILSSMFDSGAIDDINKQLKNSVGNWLELPTRMSDMTDKAMVYYNAFLNQIVANANEQLSDELKLRTGFSDNLNPLISNTDRSAFIDADTYKALSSLDQAAINALGLRISAMEIDADTFAATLSTKLSTMQAAVLGWTMSLPEKIDLNIDNFSTTDMEVLAAAGIRFNGDNTVTFMKPMNENTSGTSRDITLTRDDFSKNLLSDFYDRGLSFLFGSDGTKMNIDNAKLSKSMSGALFDLGNDYTTQLSDPEKEALAGLGNFNGKYFEITNKAVLSGQQTIADYLKKIPNWENIKTPQLEKDLLAVDSMIAIFGRSAEALVKAAEAIRIAAPNYLTQEQATGIGAAGASVITTNRTDENGNTLDAQDILVNNPGKRIENGVSFITEDKWKEMTNSLRNFITDLGIVSVTETGGIMLDLSKMSEDSLALVTKTYMDGSTVMSTEMKTLLEQLGVDTSNGMISIQTDLETRLGLVNGLWKTSWETLSADAKITLGNLLQVTDGGMLDIQKAVEGSVIGKQPGGGSAIIPLGWLPEEVQKQLLGPNGLKDVTKNSLVQVATAADEGVVTIEEALAKLTAPDGTLADLSASMTGTADSITAAFENLGDTFKTTMQDISNQQEWRAAATAGANKGISHWNETVSQTGTAYSDKYMRYNSYDSSGKANGIIVVNKETLATKRYKDEKELADNPPRFYDGGLITNPGWYQAGEFGKKEAVIPLENIRALKYVGRSIADAMPVDYNGLRNATASQVNSLRRAMSMENAGVSLNTKRSDAEVLADAINKVQATNSGMTADELVEVLAPMLASRDSNDTRPIIFVQNMIADDAGLRELNRQMRIIEQDSARRRGE